MSPKERFIRAMIARLTESAKTEFYSRGGRVYVDTRTLKGEQLMLLEGGDFSRFLMQFAKKSDNILLRKADADFIIDNVSYYAEGVAKPLSVDNRAAFRGEQIVISTGWVNGELLVVEADSGSWGTEEVKERIFEPIAPAMCMTIPVKTLALRFPALLKEGIADFGEYHCLIAVSCATMMLPATFPHPFLVFTGDQARGKSTTMKLLLQLVDPYAGAELMSVGKDARDLIALCRDRHCIALDNISKLPFDEDLLSKMYSGGIFAARQMTTNSELSKAHMPRLRVMMNGIGTFFSRSDLLSRCIFIEHPVLTQKDEQGYDLFQSTEEIEGRWSHKLPEALGSLLSAMAAGWKLYKDRGGHIGKRSRCRYVEYAVIGECMAQAMGYEEDIFTEQVNRAAEDIKERAIEMDDCAQLVLAWLNGESATPHLPDF